MLQRIVEIAGAASEAVSALHAIAAEAHPTPMDAWWAIRTLEVIRGQHPHLHERVDAAIDAVWTSFPETQRSLALSLMQGAWRAVSSVTPFGETVAEFEILDAPVTAEMYLLFDPAHPTSRLPESVDLSKVPLAPISWYEADAFARWLGLSLPTSEEWEHARKSGVDRILPWDTVLKKKTSHFADSNLLEWCLDTGRPSDTESASSFYMGSEGGHAIVIQSPLLAEERVVRGGSYVDSAPTARTVANSSFHAITNANVGFRLVRRRAC